MKILVVSDTHGDLTFLNEILRKNPSMDLYIHCGDICLAPYEVPSPLAVVKGNCDYFEYPRKLDLPSGFGNIHVEHGDYYLARTDEYIKNQKCFIYLYGHTHSKKAYRVGETYVFNPGSLTRPRDGSPSYLIIGINDESGEIKYEFKLI